jgi:hypothetical protein
MTFLDVPSFEAKSAIMIAGRLAQKKTQPRQRLRQKTEPPREGDSLSGSAKIIGRIDQSASIQTAMRHL